jgi:hypothetical protein
MVPTVAQQLHAIRHTIAKVIAPAIDPDESFAAEQAGLVLASLDWVMDVVDHEQRYEQLEHHEQRELLEGLLALAPSAGAGDARAALAAAAEIPDDLPALRAQTVELKRCVEVAFDALTATADTPAHEAARRLVTAASRRQIAREQAWTRMTGFSGEVADVGAVLAAQSHA